jgi:hypothetical protein
MATSTLSSYQQPVSTSRIPVTQVLLNNATGNTDGTWQYAGGAAPSIATVEGVAGTFAATVEIHGSTQLGQPANSDNSRVLLYSTTNTSQAFMIPQGYQWVKARVTGYASGTIFSGLVVGG